MYIKYCLKCQLNSVNKLEKCPHELQPIKVPSKVWAQIGKKHMYSLVDLGGAHPNGPNSFILT